MSLRKLAGAILFPPIAVLIVLVPLSAGGLIYSFTAEGAQAVSIAFYTLSFYTLVILCVRIPGLIRGVRNFKRQNRYVRTWEGDVRLRTCVTLGGNVIWNGAYGALQLGLGIYHRSAWFYSLAAYYATLAVMRFLLVRYALRNKPGQRLRWELGYYRVCGWVFLLTNLALSGMMFYMIYEQRAVHHSEITTIAMAAYTFTTLTMAIVNVVRYKKFNSPVLSAAKAVSLAAACVSMLTLENTMLTTFSGTDMTPGTVRLFLSLSGGAISALIVAMAIIMIVRATRKIKRLEA